MFTSYEFPLKDYAIFRIGMNENLVAVTRAGTIEIYAKKNRHNIFRMIPSRYTVEVIPLPEPDADGNVFLKHEKKLSVPMNRLRPVIIAIDMAKENGQVV